jgi:hypothetical protein
VSYTTGTATDYADLLNKLDTFLTATAGWTSKRSVAGSEMIWAAPGSGSDAILVGAKTFTDATGNYFNWRLGGFTAFDAALAFTAQAGYVGASGPSPVLPLWNSAIPYWFIGNARRVIIVAKVSTTYMVAYLGWITPYVYPAAFPYPLVVAGAMAWNAEPGASSPNWQWSYAGNEMSAFWKPANAAAIASDGASSLRLRLPTGVWRGISAVASDATFGQLWPWSDPPQYVRENLDSSNALLPAMLHDASPNVYGELDGVFFVTGYNESAENTVTIGGVAHLVVPNVFRAGQGDFAAIRLS